MRYLYSIGLAFQALYYIITGIWPLIDIASFMDVTGPKTDTWLVQTVGILIIIIGIALITGIRRKEKHVLVLSVCTSAGFVFIDTYFSLSGIISKIYLADAIVEAILLLFIIISWSILRKEI